MSSDTNGRESADRRRWLSGAAGWVGVLLWAASTGAGIVDQIKAGLGGRRALVVQLGAGDGELALALGKDPAFVVHAVEVDGAAVAKARAAILKAGLCGRTLVEQGELKALPHVNGLANVVVVDDWARAEAAGLSAAEVVRILAPEGQGWVGQSAASGKAADESQLREWLAKGGIKDARIVKQDGLWATFVKERPAGADEWSHKWHDSTRNSASQDKLVTDLAALKWIGSDPYTWQMRHGRTGGARVVLVYDHNAGMSRWGTYKEDAVTFEVLDAYSGVLQWKRKFAPGFKLGFDPVVAGDLIVTPVEKQLHALDANSGQTKVVYADVGDVRGGAVCEGVVVTVETQAISGWDLKTGKRLWKYESKVPHEVTKDRRGSSLVSGMDAYCVVAADGLFFMSEKAKDSQWRLFGLDLRTGEEKWTFADPAMGEVYPRHWYYMGRLMVSARNGLYGLPVKPADKPAWRIPVTTFDKKTWAVAGEGLKDAYKNYFGVNGLVWVRSGTQSGMVFAPKDAAQKPAAAKTWIGYDVHTGREAKRVGYDVDGGWQQRCFPDQATPAFILSSNNEIVDLNTGQINNYRALRGMCGEGPFYGNGTYYVPTHYCIFCYPMVRGSVAISPQNPPPTPVADEARLEKGPAYAESAVVGAPKPDEWPSYRGNPKRTSGTTASLAWPVAQEPVWKASFGQRVVAPVIADGRALVTIVNEGRIVALDAASGKELWTYVAGPRIDLPPTVHAGQVLFGSHDGYLYCLRASDGALAWRFCAAPERRRMVTCDRVESSWPLMGSVLVADGVVYCLAGRITRCDGGMHMYALDAVNGRMKWHKVLSGTKDPQLATGIPCWKELEGQMMNNLLCVEGDELRLPDEHQVWQFSAKTGEYGPRQPPAPPPPGPDGKQPEASYLGWYGEGFPHLGFDRPTIGWLMHGLEPVAELRHPYESGIPTCFPDHKSVGLIVKRIRKSNEGQFTVLTPAKPAEFETGWAEKTAWKTRLMASENPYADVYAEVAAGQTAYLACATYTPPQEDGVIRAINLKDGKVLDESVKLAACPVYDGMAVAYGKLFVALRDGTVMCLAKK